MKKTNFLLLAFATFGCAEQMDSSDVRTSGIRAEFEILAFGGDSDETRTQASALLYGGSDPLKMTNNDYLEVIQVGGETKRMTRKANAHDYLAHFDTKEEDTEFVFAFMRGPDDTSAPDSRVTLPPPFVVKGMEDNGEMRDTAHVHVSRNSDVVLTWDEDHTNDQVNYEVAGGSGTCLRSRSGSVGTNSGSITIPASAFTTMESDADEDCGASLFVELERTGARDDAYKSGTVRAKQRYWIKFVSIP